MLKRYRSSVELLPHDVVELILERLPVQSLLRFKSVSIKWKSTIESRRFQETQFLHRRQSRAPDILCMPLNYHCNCDDDDDADDDDLDTRIVFGPSIISKISFTKYCHGSCDGLVCLYSTFEPFVVVNPATRYHRSFPLSSYQQLRRHKLRNLQRGTKFSFASHELGFGKDKIRGTYKPVWLYNSSEFGLDNVTTCEVFDFSTNAWRYVLPASPCPVPVCLMPVYLDGSLYWFTESEDILSLDLHTETFQVIAKAPYPQRGVSVTHNVNMCILDNRLCVSRKTWPIQVIWSLNSCKTWNKMCSINLTQTSVWFQRYTLFLPIAILDKNKLLLSGPGCCKPLPDTHTNLPDNEQFDDLYEQDGNVTLPNCSPVSTDPISSSSKPIFLRIYI